jgi:predicted O-methyltransferase YrrM
MEFKRFWFDSVAKRNFEDIFLNFPNLGITSSAFLQIGVYTGDATQWLGANILPNNHNLVLHDVDTWLGSPESEHAVVDFSKVEEFYDSVVRELSVRDQIVKHKQTSDEFFEKIPSTQQFDFIYIDGHHHAEFVIRDALNSFHHLAKGGIIAFDDYGYGENYEAYKKPAPAIDFFLMAYSNQIEILISNYQVWVMKK